MTWLWRACRHHSLTSISILREPLIWTSLMKSYSRWHTSTSLSSKLSLARITKVWGQWSTLLFKLVILSIAAVNSSISMKRCMKSSTRSSTTYRRLLRNSKRDPRPTSWSKLTRKFSRITSRVIRLSIRRSLTPLSTWLNQPARSSKKKLMDSRIKTIWKLLVKLPSLIMYSDSHGISVKIHSGMSTTLSRCSRRVTLAWLRQRRESWSSSLRTNVLTRRRVWSCS